MSIINWNAIPEDFNFVSVDLHNVCRVSTARPTFLKDGSARVDPGHQYTKGSQVLASLFPRLNWKEIAEYYPAMTVIERNRCR